MLAEDVYCILQFEYNLEVTKKTISFFLLHEFCIICMHLHE
jgi:hypothetical protein